MFPVNTKVEYGDDRENMERVCTLIKELLAERDPRFDPTLHLNVGFQDFSGKEIGRFWIEKVFLPGENFLAPPQESKNKGSAGN